MADLKKTKSDSIVEGLRAAILRGEFGPGDWLRQESLASRFGVSHIPVREALNRLEAEGLVERIPHQGARVVAYNLDVAQVYYDLRARLEPYAVQLACARLSAKQLDELLDLVEQAEDLLARQKLDELTQSNWRFHERIVTFSGSRLVQDVLARVRRSFRLDTLLMIPERADDSVREHRAIYEALRAGKADRAAKLMKENVLNAKKSMLSRLPGLAISEEQS